MNGFEVSARAAQAREPTDLAGQFAAVDEVLGGRKNLVLIARLSHLNYLRKVADDLLVRFHHTVVVKRRVPTYSGGKCRRLDIEMRFIGTPPVVFPDEPTSGLGSKRLEVCETVKALVRLNMTHLLDDAEQLADRIAFPHRVRIFVNGTFNELKQ